jgi:hypothetical protein
VHRLIVARFIYFSYFSFIFLIFFLFVIAHGEEASACTGLGSSVHAGPSVTNKEKNQRFEQFCKAPALLKASLEEA